MLLFLVALLPVAALGFTCPAGSGLFRDPEDCGKYYQCWNNRAHSKSCPTGLVFNYKNKYCDWPANVDCNPGPTDAPKPPTTAGPTKPTEPTKPYTGPTPSPSDGIGSFFTKAMFEAFFPHRNVDGKAKYKIFEYENLLKAAAKFPKFGSEGSLAMRKREVAGFLAHIAQETTGGWDTAPGGRYVWGLYFPEEMGCDVAGKCAPYCAVVPEYPCVAGKGYHGRGPIQLSYNYNYGLFSKQFLGDKMILLNDPDKVKKDGVLAFSSGLWFWMTAQDPKPSCHDALIGNWKPTAKDLACGRKAGFGVTINIVNGGVECHHKPMKKKTFHRVETYKIFCKKLGTTTGANLNCETQQQFSAFCGN